jgi:hypothetical protein
MTQKDKIRSPSHAVKHGNFIYIGSWSDHRILKCPFDE